MAKWEMWGEISKALGVTLAKAKKANPDFMFKVKTEKNSSLFGSGGTSKVLYGKRRK